MTRAGLLELAHALSRELRTALVRVDLAPRQFRALEALRDGPLRLGELAAQLEIRVPSCVSLVNRLVEEGIVVRRPDRDDARVSLVALTPSGLERLADAERVLAETFDELSVTLARDGFDGLFAELERRAT